MKQDGQLLLLMGIFYLITISVETPILIAGLSRRHPIRKRFFAGIWLTACTYPIVWIVLQRLIADYNLYIVVAEIFAPTAECLLFWLAFGRTEPRTRHDVAVDCIAITIANVASFLVGVLINLRWDVWKWV